MRVIIDVRNSHSIYESNDVDSGGNRPMAVNNDVDQSFLCMCLWYTTTLQQGIQTVYTLVGIASWRVCRSVHKVWDKRIQFLPDDKVHYINSRIITQSEITNQTVEVC